MSLLNDINIRFEALRIAGKQLYSTQGIQEVLFNAQLLYEFVKTGEMPKSEKLS